LKLLLYIRILLLSAILSLFIGPAAAQLYYKAKTITVEDGLSDKRVTCFFKDSKGYMWIGTRNGLNRYDGHSFKIFRPAQVNSISNEVINDIAEDSDGRIWVATMEGLNYYDPTKDHWECLVPDPDNEGGEIPNYIVWDIWFDKNDLLWIASDVFEFCSYDPHSKDFTYYDWPGFARANLNFPGFGKYNSIQKFVARNDHSFWLATTKGLVSLDIKTSQFSLIGGDYYASVIDLQYDTEHKRIFLSTEKGQLFQYDEPANSYSKLSAQPEPYPSARFSQAPQHEIWLASDRGLVKINEDRSAVYLATHIPQLSGSLLPGGVNNVYKDNTGIHWIATANGISVYDPSARISAFLPLLAASDKEGSNRMTGVYFDDISNRYFAGAADPACVFVIDAGNGTINKITRDAKGDTLSSCRAIVPDRDKNIWLLMESNVYRYDRVTGQFILFPTPNKKDKAAFRSMIQDANGDYWFSTFNEGLFYYKTSEKRFAPLKDTNAQYLSAATGLVSDPAHRQVLIGTFGEGTFTYDLDKQLLTGYYETREVRDYSQLVLVHDMEMDGGGRVWVSTHSGGVFRYNHGAPYNQAFTRFDMKKGLNNNNILSLCSDGDSTIWLLSGNGISAIDTSGRFLYDINDDRTFSFSIF
jgi:ligand-binding sensor domain-containing protein